MEGRVCGARASMLIYIRSECAGGNEEIKKKSKEDAVIVAYSKSYATYRSLWYYQN